MKFLRLFLSFSLLATSQLFAMNWWGEPKEERIKLRQTQANEQKQKALEEIKRQQTATKELKKIAKDINEPLRMPVFEAYVVSLIKQGADPNITTTDFLGTKEPLLTLAVPSYPQIVTALLDAGADPETKDTHGRTALMIAMQYIPGNIPISVVRFESLIKYLLDAGADPNAGNLPLSFAVFAGNEYLIKLLLQAGADPNLKYKDSSPLEIAYNQLSKARDENNAEAESKWHKIIEWLENPATAPRIAPKEKLK